MAVACCPVGIDRDVVVPGGPPALGLGPPDAFPDLFDPFPGAGLGKPLGGFGEGVPEKRPAMARSMAACPSERQYGRASRPSSDTPLCECTSRFAAVRMWTECSASKCRVRSRLTTRYK